MGKSKNRKKQSSITPKEEKKAFRLLMSICLGLALIAILIIIGFSLT